MKIKSSNPLIKWKVFSAVLFVTAFIMLLSDATAQIQGCLPYPNTNSPADPPTVNPCVPCATNTTCATAQTLELNAECTPGTVNCGGAQPSPSCWAPYTPSLTVWYTFVTKAAGVYRISTDNGVGDFDSDTRLALYGGTCTSLQLLKCNDDTVASCGVRTSIIYANLAATTTYYVAVDKYPSSTVLDFCINVTKDTTSANDCIQNACDISGFVGQTLTRCRPFDSDAYTYYHATPTKAPDPNLDPADTLCNGFFPCNAFKNDVWFKFTVTSGVSKNWLSVFPNNGCNYYGMQLYDGSGLDTASCDTAGGLALLGQSLGDLNPLSCGCVSSRDKARRSAMLHPRLDISGLIPGTYYVRVWQFTRINGITSLCDPATDAIFNLVLEAEPRVYQGDTVSIDSLTRDRCVDAPTLGCYTTCDLNVTPLVNSKHVHDTRTCLTNAGLSGNVWAGSSCPANGCSAAPLTNEPLQLQSGVAFFNGSWEPNCNGNGFTTVGGCKNPNTTGFYKFKVPNIQVNVPCRDLLNTLPLRNVLCSLIALITPPLPAEIYNLLCTPLICTNPLVDTVRVPALGQTSITLNNIRTVGVNGNELRAYVYPHKDDCTLAEPIVMHAFPDACDNSVCFKPTSFNCESLPPGCYTLVIDGEDAQLLQYDLTLDITMIEPINCTPVILDTCGSENSQRYGFTPKNIESGLKLKHVVPVPSRDRVEIAYVSGNEGTMKVEVYSLIGQKVYSGSFETNVGENIREINISGLKPGVYLLNMEQNGEKLQTRIVKVD
jgi:hypothetical protein